MANRLSGADILRAIASAYSGGLKTPTEAISDALQALIEEVGCSRVSLWRFESQAGGRALRCFVWKLAGLGSVPDATLLEENQYREYFSELVRSGVFVSNDAMADSRLRAMRGPYLQVHSISALLDIPITINGRSYGIVCCEQIRAQQLWTAKQVSAARATVTRAGLLVARELETRLSEIESVPLAPF